MSKAHRLVAVLVVLFLTSGFAVAREPSAPESGLSVHTGIGVPGFVPYDFAAISVFRSSGIPIGSYLGNPDLAPLGLVIRWDQYGSPTRVLLLPRTEVVTIRGSWRLVDDAFGLIASAGPTFVINRGGNGTGLAASVAAVVVWQPATWLEFSAPMDLSVYLDGTAVSGRLAAMAFIPGFPVGIEFSLGGVVAASWSDGRTTADMSSQVSVGWGR